jgi:hypothetical protein
MFFYLATVNTPAMAWEMIGVGSQYAYTERDSTGAYLDGSKEYRLTLPTGVPAKHCWSIVVYDPQTRSELQTIQPYPSRNSKRDNVVLDNDGSITLTFGPNRPIRIRTTGFRPCPARAGSPSSACMDPSRPDLTRPGDRERSNLPGDSGNARPISGMCGRSPLPSAYRRGCR